MKFWKQSLLAAFILTAIFGTIIIVSCEKDPCTDQSCQHGGSCGNGVCTCPIGYDGPTCENRTVKRFLGAFAGSSYCDNGAPVIDSAFVLADTFKTPLSVKLVIHTNNYDTLYGTVGINASVWAITIPIEYGTNYYKIYTVTLQSNNKLTINTFTDDKSNPNQEVQHKCTFLGFWTQLK